MPLKINRRCKVCQVIEAGDNQLLQRIYQSAKFRTNGEPLKHIHEDYEGSFKYLSLIKHTKAHQFVRESDLKRSVRAEIVKNGSNAAAMELIKHGDVRQLVMDKGSKGIRSGKIKLKASDVLKAAKDQADVEAKGKDHALLAVELMMKIAAGQITPIGMENANTTGTSSSGTATTEPTDPA